MAKSRSTKTKKTQRSSSLDVSMPEWVRVPYEDGNGSSSGLKIISLEHFGESRPSVELRNIDPNSGVSPKTIGETFDALIEGDAECWAAFDDGCPDDIPEEQKRKWLSLVEIHLISLAKQYRKVKNYLTEQHGIQIPSEEFDQLRAEYLDKADEFMARARREYSFNDIPWYGFSSTTDEIDFESGMDIFGAIAALYTVKEIGRILKISLENDVAEFTLDSSLQLADNYRFLSLALALLRLDDIKKRGWAETMSRARIVSAEFVRDKIKERLQKLLAKNDKEKFRYTHGKRKGKLKIEFLAGQIQREFDTDTAWTRSTPGITIVREEIRNFGEQF